MNRKYCRYLFESKKIAWIFFFIMHAALTFMSFITNGFSNKEVSFTMSMIVAGVLSGILSFVLPVFLFSYVHRKRSCDMYFSTPIDRKEMLVTTLLFSWILCFGYFAVIGLAEYFLFGMETVPFVNFMKFILYFGLGLAVLLLINTFFYLLANNLLDGVVMVLAYSLLPVFLSFLEIVAVDTYSANTMSVSSFPLALYLSPVAVLGENMACLTGNLLKNSYTPICFDWAALFALLAFGVIGCIGLKKEFVDRKSERAEQVSNGLLAYPTVMNLYLFAILALLAVSIVSNTNWADTLIIYVLLFFVYILANFVYRRKIYVSWKNAVYFVGVVIVTLGLAQFSWKEKGFGYAYRYSLTQGDTLHYSYNAGYGEVTDDTEYSGQDAYIDFSVDIPVKELGEAKNEKLVQILEEYRTSLLDEYFSRKVPEWGTGNLYVESTKKSKPYDTPLSDYSYYGTALTMDQLREINMYTPVTVSIYDYATDDTKELTLQEYLGK